MHRHGHLEAQPDAKWRIRPGALAIRIAEQDRALEEAARFVKPRGRILYATCSVLREENEDRLAAFLGSHADYKSLPALELAGMGRDAWPWAVRFAIWFWSASHAADERHRWFLHRHAHA